MQTFMNATVPGLFNVQTRKCRLLRHRDFCTRRHLRTRQLTSEPISERSSGDFDDGISGGMHQRRERERDAAAVNGNG